MYYVKLNVTSIYTHIVVYKSYVNLWDRAQITIINILLLIHFKFKYLLIDWSDCNETKTKCYLKLCSIIVYKSSHLHCFRTFYVMPEQINRQTNTHSKDAVYGFCWLSFNTLAIIFFYIDVQKRLFYSFLYNMYRSNCTLYKLPVLTPKIYMYNAILRASFQLILLDIKMILINKCILCPGSNW